MSVQFGGGMIVWPKGHACLMRGHHSWKGGVVCLDCGFTKGRQVRQLAARRAGERAVVVYRASLAAKVRALPSAQYPDRERYGYTDAIAAVLALIEPPA